MDNSRLKYTAMISMVFLFSLWYTVCIPGISKSAAASDHLCRPSAAMMSWIRWNFTIFLTSSMKMTCICSLLNKVHQASKIWSPPSYMKKSTGPQVLGIWMLNQSKWTVNATCKAHMPSCLLRHTRDWWPYFSLPGTQERCGCQLVQQVHQWSQHKDNMILYTIIY